MSPFAGGSSCSSSFATVCLFFFFSSRRRHTRCLSDWSSDVCSSDLYASQFAVTGLGAVKGAADKLAHEIKRVAAGVFGATPDDVELADGQARLKRSEERRVGKECRSRWTEEQ